MIITIAQQAEPRGALAKQIGGVDGILGRATRLGRSYVAIGQGSGTIWLVSQSVRIG